MKSETNEVLDAKARTHLDTAEAARNAGGSALEKDSWASPTLQLDQWHKAEQVAMHFNDLLMRFRLQALGGLSVVAAIAGLASKETAEDLRQGLPWAVAFISAAWVALWVLDSSYYSALLHGAVDEVLAVESRLPAISMSHKIRNRVSRWGDRYAAHFFYGLILVVLVACFGASVVRASQTIPPKTDAAPVSTAQP